ncbi:MAG: hypothetical protein RJQ00_02625 [Vicingaceae bacterium]
MTAENHHVIQSYLNHKGAHFKVINRVGGEREENIVQWTYFPNCQSEGKGLRHYMPSD